MARTAHLSSTASSPIPRRRSASSKRTSIWATKSSPTLKTSNARKTSALRLANAYAATWTTPNLWPTTPTPNHQETKMVHSVCYPLITVWAPASAPSASLHGTLPLPQVQRPLPRTSTTPPTTLRVTNKTPTWTQRHGHRAGGIYTPVTSDGLMTMATSAQMMAFTTESHSYSMWVMDTWWLSTAVVSVTTSTQTTMNLPTSIHEATTARMMGGQSKKGIMAALPPGLSIHLLRCITDVFMATLRPIKVFLLQKLVSIPCRYQLRAQERRS